MSEDNHDSFTRRIAWIYPVVVAMGVVLIVCSFLPLQWAADQYWTPQDSLAFDRISLEYHKSAFQPAHRAGRTEEEMETYREELKSRFEKMQGKLLFAQRQPRRLSHFFLWTGAALVAIGGVANLLHKSQ